MLKVDTEKARQ